MCSVTALSPYPLPLVPGCRSPHDIILSVPRSRRHLRGLHRHGCFPALAWWPPPSTAHVAGPLLAGGHVAHLHRLASHDQRLHLPLQWCVHWTQTTAHCSAWRWLSAASSMLPRAARSMQNSILLSHPRMVRSQPSVGHPQSLLLAPLVAFTGMTSPPHSLCSSSVSWSPNPWTLCLLSLQSSLSMRSSPERRSGACSVLLLDLKPSAPCSMPSPASVHMRCLGRPRQLMC